MALFGAVEGGGTKYLCVLATAPDPSTVVAMARVDTTDPATTLDQVIAFFREEARGAPLAAVGVASFGPVELDEASDRYGYILSTPKSGWSNQPILPRLASGLGLPLRRLSWENDVTAAAIGESRWGAGVGADPLVYVTVGTGIGGGAIVDGRPLHGLLHPEMGHLPMPIALLPDGRPDPFPGHGCPFHSRCWESMASGPALAARAGRPAATIADADPIWDLEAQYIAFGLAGITLALSPRRIVIGGGVVESRAEWLLPIVRRHLATWLGGYIGRAELASRIDHYIVPPALVDPSPALAGALVLAGRAAVA